MRRQLEVSSLLFIALSLALVAGCGPTSSGDTMVDSGMMVGNDAGNPGTDAGSSTGCSTNSIPTSGFGATIGRKFSPITLNDCAGMPHDFYSTTGDHNYCDSTLTVFVIAAGWCHPCNLESDQLESMLIMPYASRGVRVVQVLTQNDTYGVPTTPGFCDNWMTRHSLSYTDHLTLLDPDGLTQIYDPAGSIPASVIVDGDGVIQDRLNGTATDPVAGTADLTELTSCLDKLLSTPRVLCH